MATKQKLTIVDLFCGAGGTSTGALLACEDLGVEADLLAINHWDVAVDTHTRNHPHVRHRCVTLDQVNPRDEVPGGVVDLLVASPECQHHSRARGGKPVSDQRRASGWLVLRWLEQLHVRALLVENVQEYAEWGPTGANGLPLKSRKGETFRAWLNAIRSLGYVLDYKVVCTADYGDPTERYRLMILARKGRTAIEWPEPSHAKRGQTTTLFRSTKPWRGAREIIDWSVPSQSIYTRKKPLSVKTMARIAEGIRRFSGGTFVLAQGQGGVARSVEHPLPTITTDGAVRVVEPFVMSYYGTKEGGKPRVRSIEDPVPTIPTENRFAVVEPFMVPPRNNGKARSLDEPLHTVTAGGNHEMLVEAFVASYYGTTNIRPVSDPLPTVTTKDRFALVQPVVVGDKMLDIRVRMFQTHELSAATSFPKDYAFAGNESQKKAQIGNAVPVETARALCRAQLKPLASRRRGTPAQSTGREGAP